MTLSKENRKKIAENVMKDIAAYVYDYSANPTYSQIIEMTINYTENEINEMVN